MPNGSFVSHSRRFAPGTVGQICLTIGVEVPDGLRRLALKILAT